MIASTEGINIFNRAMMPTWFWVGVVVVGFIIIVIVRDRIFPRR
jgi:hypothetical protein